MTNEQLKMENEKCFPVSQAYAISFSSPASPPRLIGREKEYENNQSINALVSLVQRSVCPDQHGANIG
jgi:hypothetical protein